jgi:hypothetical protein
MLIYQHNRKTAEKTSDFCINCPYGQDCALTQDTQRKLYSKIVYSDNNTSPIIPKAMNKQQLQHFYQFLLNCSDTLSKINKLQNIYELPTDNPNT